MRRWGWAVACALLMGSGALILYRAGFREAVLYAILLLCPLLHLWVLQGQRGR